MTERKINLVDIVSVLVKWRRLIYINVFAMILISVAVSLFLPNWYKAKAIILPPESKGISLGMGGIGEIAGSFFGPSGYELPMLATRSDVFLTILESRRVAEYIIEKYDFQKKYKSKNLDLTIRKLNSHLSAEVARDGSIHIAFEAKKDPELAAQVTNSYLEKLDEINMITSQSSAKSTRLFIERRLNEAKVELAKAEEEFKKFQEENNTVSIKDQTEATIKGAAELIAEQTGLKVQLGVLRSDFGPSHGKVTELKNRINEIEKELTKIKNGISDTNIQSNDKEIASDIYLPLGKVPEIGLQYARLMRELKIQEVIFELLIQQYEQAKIREQEDTPSIQVLQYAKAPTYKSRPKRSIIVLVSTSFAFFISVLLAFVLDFINRGRREGNEEVLKIDWIAKELKHDLKRLNPSRKK